MNDRAIITHEDLARINECIDRMAADAGEHYGDLTQKLDDAFRVEAERLPAEIVALETTIALHEPDTGERWTFTLTLPEDADVEEHRISVLSPLGTAILGCRAGSIVSWPAPAGTITGEIEEVLARPEPAYLRPVPG